ncbi:MAG: efflux RND transporter permease subunit [Alphaproteobacteria bacterium]|nr:efflux RND transporter permease subunit [Alphaproteobacteria bacterium]MCB9697214.1 efflux RND transporter permease subunit [Alphaproteobacteria bacterium]
MWISDFAITRPIVTVVSMVALVVFGFFALLMLDTDEFPEVNPPVVAVSIPYPGSSPESVEREIVDPLEDAFTSISGVDKIRSTALDGYCILVIEFDFEKDLQEATQDIRDKISEHRSDLPPEMEEPILVRFDPQNMPIMSMVLSSDRYGPEELTRIADPGITGELQSLGGVASVTVVGAVDPELTVALRPDALEASGIGVGQVVQALQFANLAAPVGSIVTPREERTIRLQGRLTTPAEFEAISLVSANGRLVRLGDVADVRAGSEEPRSLAMYDDHQAVGIDIVKATGASTTDVAERLIQRVERIGETLPEGVTMKVVRNAGERVDHSVEDVKYTLIEGAVLTVLVVFLFLGSWRSTIITGLALPVSVLASFVMVWAFGYTLNTMSLLGLSLAIGILIDDAIVVRENIVRHMEMGKDHLTAAHEGTAEIGLAVAATTFSIVVVFVPVAFMGGLAEQWMGPMALTIASSVMVSLFVSFSLDPMLSAYWPDPAVHTERKGLMGRILSAFDRFLDRWTRRYERLIGWALRWRFTMLGIALASFVGALALPATGLVGSSFFPVSDRSEFALSIDLPAGSSLEHSQRKVAQAVELIRKDPTVRYTYSTIGGTGGTTDEATIYVRLTPKKERDVHQDIVAGRIVRQVDRLAGVQASVQGGFGPQKQIAVELSGPDMDVLQQIAHQLEEKVKQIPGAVDVGLSTGGEKPELEVTLDRDLAASVGLTVGAVAQSLRPAFAGIDVGDWVDPQGETRDVRVRFEQDARRRPEDLASVPLVVLGPDGRPATIPLGQVAAIRNGKGPAQIQHIDRQRVVAVEANARGVPLSEVVAGIDDALKEIEMPAGYGVRQGGDSEDQAEVFGRMFGALGVAVMLMYLILVVQFGSFVDPIAIMASLPLSLIGVMLALLFTDSTVNLMSMIGVLLLMGIVAKNAILLIDFAKWAEEEGMDRKQALIQAGGTRLRPILMTSVAIVAGMLPVAIGAGEGADFRAPLGRAVIGGVITSTFLTLLVIPTIYDMLAGARDTVMRWVMPARPAHPEPHPTPGK